MSKGGGGQSSTTTTAPPAWVQPIVQGVAHDITGTAHGNAGALQGLSNSLNGALPGIQSMALDQSHLQPGQDYLNSVLSGHYLGQNNPYMNQMIQQTGQDVGNKVNSTFSQAGRTAGGANQQLLSRGLADSENALRYQDYSNERNNMTQAASQLPAYQAARTSGVNSLLGAYQTAGQLPYYGANAESGIGSLFGGFSNSSTHQNGGGSTGSDLLSAGLALLPFALSDRRAKDNIEFVMKLDNGLGLYEFDYKPQFGIEGRWRGVMADEVKTKMPWMLGPETNGYMTVKFQPSRIA